VGGLVDDTPHHERNAWWDSASLDAMERLLPSTHMAAFQTKARASKKGNTPPQEDWLRYTARIFEDMEAATPDREPPAKPANPMRNPANRFVQQAAVLSEGRQTRSRGVTPQASPAKREAIKTESVPPSIDTVPPETVRGVDVSPEETIDNGKAPDEGDPTKQAGLQTAQQAQSSRPAIRFTFKAGEAAKPDPSKEAIKQESS
jgi:hypothetical protein